MPIAFLISLSAAAEAVAAADVILLIITYCLPCSLISFHFEFSMCHPCSLAASHFYISYFLNVHGNSIFNPFFDATLFTPNYYFMLLLKLCSILTHPMILSLSFATCCTVKSRHFHHDFSTLIWKIILALFNHFIVVAFFYIRRLK